MIVKGIISAIYAEQEKLSVILPEYDNATTPPLPIYGDTDISKYSVNEFVIIIMFNQDFSDGIVLDKHRDIVHE